MRVYSLLGACALGALATPAFAQDSADSGAFDLGRIVVTAPAPAQDDDAAIGSSTLGSEAIERFKRDTLDDAVKLIPGVTAANSGGSRNERLIFVRGFDRFQVPLSIDGIRIYLPADNRLDFGRFLTPDVAEIQVAKGYASVLDGPGAMGGAINLVTRKPTQPFEVEVRSSLDLDSDLAASGYTTFGLVGTRQDKWYGQISFAHNETNFWTLSDDFVPVRLANEDGGRRDFSDTEDSRLNIKLGFTPNASDEYSLSYTRQDGSKNAPLHISDNSNVSLRNWSWPYWDIQSLYWLSTTALGGGSTLKTRAYYSEYDNLLRSWDNRDQNSQSAMRAFNSPYADNAWGGSAELDLALSAANTLSLAAHYRKDTHTETQTSRPDLPTAVPEPIQTTEEDTFSVAAQDLHTLSSALSLTLGVSYDWRKLDKAEEFNTTTNTLFEFPKADADGFNAQGRIDWAAGDASTLHVSVSSRIRFPTIFERFSSQFGTAEPNPTLKPERATNFEIGGEHRFGAVRAVGAVFYSRVNDALVSVRTPANLNRRENYGTGDYYGAELSLDAALAPSLDFGVNYSYIHRDFDVGTPPAGGLIRPFELTDVPDHKGFVWLAWRPLKRLEIVPSADFASDRVTVTPASANGLTPVYYDTGDHFDAALRIDYTLPGGLVVGAGVRNLLDENYVLTDGFPEPGRRFYATLRWKN